jgi:LacI family xylobiose transport system transcriptional regulator
MAITTGIQRVKLSDVAEEAGVSLSTISKVLNGRSDVAAGTRAKVEGILERDGYRRRGSERRESVLVELVFPKLDNAWSMEIIKGVETIARANGMGVVLTESDRRDDPGPEWISGVIRRRPTGVVLVFSDLAPEHSEQLRSRGIPFVIVDPAGDPAPGVPAVGSTNWSGGLSATRYLLELGHTRIGMITGPADMMCSLARLDGYRSALSTAGITVDPDLIRYGNFQVDGGRARAEELLSLAEPPTAIFAGSDLQAVGVIEAARAHHLAVPDDLSVIGYDDIPLAQWLSPNLTTVHQPLQKMAEEATRMILQLREGTDSVQTRIDLATHLVVRGSTAPRKRS